MKNTKIGLIISGNKYHKELIASILKDNSNYLIKELNSNIDTSNSVIYHVMGKGPEPYKNINLWLSRKNLLILHWIGTDVLDVIRSYSDYKLHIRTYHRLWNILLRYKYNNGTLIHLAGAPWLVDELETVGIKARYLPLTSISTQNLETFTTITEKDIDVISYVPYRKFNFYGGSELIKLAEELPMYKFLLIHSDLDEIIPDVIRDYPVNVIASPKIEFKDMHKLYLRSKLFLRLTEHDGLSLSVLEALLYKLHVFWTYPFPNTHLIQNHESLREGIIQNVENWSPNVQGHEYVKENFLIENWKNQFKIIVNELISENSY